MAAHNLHCEADAEYWRALKEAKEQIETVCMKRIPSPFDDLFWIIDGKMTTPGIIQLDVYTCGAFDPNKVFEWLQQFDIGRVDWKYIDREHGLQELDYTPPARPLPTHNYTTTEIVEAIDSILSR